MEKLIVLGTGSAGAISNFNTCFALQKDHTYFLVDTGGGNGILKRLEEASISILNIHDVFISHKHADHLLGILWIFRAVNIAMEKGTYQGNFTIYCHEAVAEIIRSMVTTILRPVQQKYLDKRVFIQVVHDEEVCSILGYDVCFLDLKAKSDKQYGFTFTLENGKRLFFAGDEPLDVSLYEKVRNVDYLFHEAFCLESEASVFHPYEKNHDTVLSASKKAEELQVKNLVLWHTQENLKEERQRKYLWEAKQYFHRNIYVPNDLDVIDFDTIDKVGGILLQDKKILVQRKKNNRVECIIPGGKREGNENDFETLQRELKEEICVDLVSMEYFGSYDDIACFSGKPLHVEAYLATVEGEIVCDHEIKEAIWIARDYKEQGIVVGSILGDYIIPSLIEKGLM